jgi:RHS repeat-associated protein
MLLKRNFSILLAGLILVTGNLVPGPLRMTQGVQAASSSSSPDVTSRPDKVSARLTAKLEGHRVQITDFDATASTTYANPDGSFTTEVSSVPIRTHRATGLVPIDTHLVAAGSSWQPAAADGDVSISGGGSGDIASATSGSARVGIGFGASLPKPGISGDTATYTNVIPGVNVVARATEGGFDLEFVLTSRPSAPLSLKLPLDLHGVRVTQDSGGILHYLDAKGQDVFTTSAPVMSGAAVDPQADMPTRSEAVATKLVTASSGAVLEVTPDQTFLADPTVTYPVTIDPTTNIGQSNYDYVALECPTCQNYNNTLTDHGYTAITHSGTWNSGTDKERAFYGFSNSSYSGKYVTGATLTLFEYWSYSCSAREVDVWDLTGNYGPNLDWNNQPGVATEWASANVAHGYSSSCSAANVSFDVTGLAQHWSPLASGVYDLEVRAASETDSYGWKSFTGAATLAVTYDSYPNTPTNPATSPATPCTTGSGRPYVSTTTPRLSATVSDPDGDTLQGAFEIWHTGGSEIGGQNYSSSVASGSAASWTVPAGNFVNGSTYSWRTRSWDGVNYSQNYSPWCEFTIDTSVDPAPSISSTSCPQNAWAPTGTSCSFSWSDSSTDVSGYQSKQDSGAWSATSSATTLTWSPAVGQHTLQVQALNAAALPGNIASYTFIVGSAGSLATPADQDRTQASVALSANAPTTYPYADYFYRQGSTATFSQVPAADVTLPGTTTNPTWPVAGDANGNFSTLNWNLATSVRSAGGSDGLVQVEACVYTSQTQALTSPSACSPTHNVQLLSHAFGATYASENVGPGSVSLLTGDYQLSSTDASVPSATGNLSVGRSITTSDPTGELRNLLPSNLHDAEPPLNGWSSTVNATATTVTAPTILGSSSLQLAPSAGPSCSGQCWDSYVPIGGDNGALRLGMKPGHTYTFTAREYVPPGTGLTPDTSTRGERPVAFYQIGTQGYVEIDGTMPTATAAWQLVLVTFTVPDGATEAYVRLYNGFNVGKTSDPVYYDDLSLVADAIHGVEWQTSLPGPAAGASDLRISDDTSQGYVVLTAPDGSEVVYTPTTPTSSYPISYSGQGDAHDGSVLSKTSASQFTLTDADGTMTTWNSSDGGNTWQVASVAEPGSSTTTSYSFDGDGRVTQVVGPAPVGVACTGSGINPLTTPGCRTLTLTYTSTTATPPSGSTLGNYPGLLQSISFTAADPTNSNQMTTVAIASFAYDAGGFLRQSWDPRLPNLKTSYTYGPDLRISSVTPPGLNAWSLSFDSAGRLSQATRPDPSGGTDTTTVVYNAPFTGTGAPIEMGSATTSAWGETSDLPNYAAAVFDPNHSMPAGTTAATVSSSDWPYATVHYLDVNGRQVNTASYGAGAWQISTTGYDKSGNTLTQLTPLARNEALSPANYPDLDGYVASIPASANRAALLSTSSTYSSDGTELTDTLGPMHPVVLSSATTVDARTHTHTTYDEGAPNNDVAADGGPYRLPTTITSAAQTSDGVDHDTRTSHKGYAAIVSGDTTGWTLRQSTTETTVVGVSRVQAAPFVQAWSGSLNLTLPAPSTPGNILVATLASDRSFSAPAGWVRATSSANWSGTSEIWYYPNSPGGISSVTFTASGTTYSTGVLSEWSGSSGLDVVGSASNSGTSTTSLAVSSAAAAVSGDLAVTAFTLYLNGGGPLGRTAGAGWTNFGQDSTGNWLHVTFDYLNGVPAGSTTETETASAAVNWTAVIALFKAGGSTADVVTTTRHDAQGHVIETRMPANPNGTDAHATLSTYFAATGSGGCVNAAEAGLLCQTGPVAQPTSGPHLLNSTTSYNMWGQPVTVTEADPSCSSSCPTRTTTTVYDAGQRECVHSVTTSNVGDTGLAAVYTGYDPNTGLATLTGNISGSVPASCPSSTPALSSQIATAYDGDGRVSTYTDANHNVSSVTYTADGLTASLNDGKGSLAYTYDSATEHRRLLTSLADSQAGTFSAVYDANGAMTSETYPSGLVATRHFDDAGQSTSLTYVMGSTTWLSFRDAYSAHGQVVSQNSNGSSQTLTYDNDGRLITVADTDNTINPAACTTRVYAYDADSNRTSLSSYPAGANGVCSTSTTPSIASHTYDEADRLAVSQGYTYDLLGRTTTVPASDAGGTTLSNGYYVNDMVASQSQGTASKGFALDPSERIATITTGTSVQTNYYANGSDSPAWIGMSDGSSTRNVEGIDGNLGVIVSSSGSEELQLSNLHGDVVATAVNSSTATGTDAYFESTEFGVPRPSNTVDPRYAWLGGKRRDSGDALAGIVLMGVRLYSPTLGRFLQLDPVKGGSANSYDYANQDPINKFDLDGTWLWAIAGGGALAGALGADEVVGVTNFWNPVGWTALGILGVAAIGFGGYALWHHFAKGSKGKFKGRDALRRENKQVRDVARQRGLSRRKQRMLHDEISGQGYTRGEIDDIADSLFGGRGRRGGRQ